MSYRPKIIRCRLKTGGKSVDEIREQYKGQGLSEEELAFIQKSKEQFDGLIVLLSLWDYDGGAQYHLTAWDDDCAERVMMGVYYAEQVHPFPSYLNKLEEFKRDWMADEYDFGGAFCFDPSEVEEIEVVAEEQK
jgi:hypothetical protein